MIVLIYLIRNYVFFLQKQITKQKCDGGSRTTANSRAADAHFFTLLELVSGLQVDGGRGDGDDQVGRANALDVQVEEADRAGDVAVLVRLDGEVPDAAVSLLETTAQVLVLLPLGVFAHFDAAVLVRELDAACLDGSARSADEFKLLASLDDLLLGVYIQFWRLLRMHRNCNKRKETVRES